MPQSWLEKGMAFQFPDEEVDLKPNDVHKFSVYKLICQIQTVAKKMLTIDHSTNSNNGKQSSRRIVKY